VNRRNKAFLALLGFLGGISFTILAFHFNHKDILRESSYYWSVCFLVCLVFCLRAIFKEAI
jgi:predicted tellurium resistance membrane protein TerC